MISVLMRNRRSRLRRLAWPCIGLFMLLLVPQQVLGAQEAAINFRLKSVEGNQAAVDVALSFKLNQGEKAILKPNVGADWEAAGMLRPQVELLSTTSPEYQIEASPPPDTEWVMTATATGDMAVEYRVIYPEMNHARNDAEAPGGVSAPGAVSVDGLRVLRGSDVLICPRRQSDLAPISDQFQVDIPVPKGQKALAPWRASGKNGSSFKVSGETELLNNYMAWGPLDLVTLRKSEPQVVAGFSRDYAKQSASQRSEYGKSLSLLMDNLIQALGKRPRLNRVAIVLVGAGRFGLNRPTYGTLLDSTVICHGGKELSGEGAAAAAGGLFQLWNAWSLVPASNGEAEWFQAGLPLFYPIRVAAVAGLMNSSKAYEDFSQVYRSYLTDPGASSTSLVEAEGSAGAQQLLALKGAAVCASLSKKLQDESKGSARDIDWLLGRLAEKFNHFKGKDYTLVDISEILEDATGQSWDRYFQQRVRGTQAILSSEFSETGLFGTTGFGKSLVVRGGSGRSWLYLLIAVLIILLIPVIFSAYVRRSVKLDLTMPKILPDDDE